MFELKFFVEVEYPACSREENAVKPFSLTFL